MNVPQSGEVNQRYIAIRNVTIIGVVVNVLLSVIKLIFGWLGQSQALIADGLHSLSDLISDAVILIAAKWSSQQADEKHPYGHGRIETLATVIVGSILILVAILMLLDAGHRLWEVEYLFKPTLLSLIIALVSIIVKEVLFQYTMLVAKRVHSPMLQANAWHHRTDAISSIIVFIGILGTFAGVTWLDAVAAIGVSVMIAHVGSDLVWRGLSELIDTALDEEKVITIEQKILAIDGVRAAHELRTRQMGANALVDVHVLVNPYISVSEGHQIAERVRQTLIQEIEEVTEVMVHIDPENDEQHLLVLNLPPRNIVAANLLNIWADLIKNKQIEQLTLHYLGSKISVELVLKTRLNLDEMRALEAKLIHSVKNINYIRKLTVLFKLDAT